MSILNIAPKELAAGVRHISTTTKVELVSAIACIACFSVWIFGSGRPTTFGIPLFFTLLCLTCSFAGRLCLRILRVFPDGVDHFPLSFLFGFFIINSALYLLAWISPFGIIADSIALIVALAVVGRALRPVRPKAPPDTREDWPSLMCVIVSLIAATLWCQDSLRPLIEGDHVVIFKPCFDGFYHACQIRMLRESHGFSSMQDILMAGQPAPFYHYASYMTPALLSAATGISPYFAFACFLVPFGIFLTGLAAFALVRSWWGAWAGFGATAALLLLPDAGQGMHMPLQSYYFRCEAEPGGPYGVAITAISWILMMKGCDSGRPSLIVVSFLSAAACIHYKSHIFVANALLLWLFPAFFARKLRWEVRVAWFVFAITSFLAIVKMTQHFPGVPLIQCDYSLSNFRSKMYKLLNMFNYNESTFLAEKNTWEILEFLWGDRNVAVERPLLGCSLAILRDLRPVRSRKLHPRFPLVGPDDAGQLVGSCGPVPRKQCVRVGTGYEPRMLLAPSCAIHDGPSEPLGIIRSRLERRPGTSIVGESGRHDFPDCHDM